MFNNKWHSTFGSSDEDATRRSVRRVQVVPGDSGYFVSLYKYENRIYLSRLHIHNQLINIHSLINILIDLGNNWNRPLTCLSPLASCSSCWGRNYLPRPSRRPNGSPWGPSTTSRLCPRQFSRLQSLRNKWQERIEIIISNREFKDSKNNA